MICWSRPLQASCLYKAKCRTKASALKFPQILHLKCWYWKWGLYLPLRLATWGRSGRSEPSKARLGFWDTTGVEEEELSQKKHWDAKGMAWSWEDEFSCLCPGEHTDQQGMCHFDAVPPARTGPNSASAGLLRAKLSHTQGLPETDLNLVTERALSIITPSFWFIAVAHYWKWGSDPWYLGIPAETDDDCYTCDSTTQYQ